MEQAKVDKKSIEIFLDTLKSSSVSRRETKKLAKNLTLSPSDQEQLLKIRGELSTLSSEELAEKKEKFSTRERTEILFRAKFHSGLSKEQRIKMYEDAGYSDDEIKSITGKKMIGTVGLNGALGTAAWIGLGAVTKYDNSLPLINLIPSSTALAFASIAAYTASYVFNTEQNLRLTKNVEASMNTYVTGLYALGNRLLPEKARDWVARGFPIGLDTFLRSGLYSSAVAGLTGNAHKVIAGCLFGAALNTIYIAGCEIILHWKRKK